MTEDLPVAGPPVRAKRPRAWWQWVLGLLLLVSAAGFAGVRVVARVWPEWFGLAFWAVKPVPLKVPEGMREEKVVPASRGDYAGHNVLFISLDTTRADRIGCYGNEKIKTPNLDALARKGVMFTQAVTPGSTTLPSHASMMTGLYPFHHGARANGVFRLPEDQRTLAEILSEKGYVTGAVVSAFVLDSRFGLKQGFDYYEDGGQEHALESGLGDPERSGDKSTDLALSWLDKNSDKPFFLWMHYFDPHQPYLPPGDLAKEYEYLPYDGEIAFVDSQIGRLLTRIEEKGLTDKTLVVVVGDHGQGLGQHLEVTHGFLLYDSTLEVPMIMACGNRLGGGVQIGREVCAVDLMPTILTLLGVDGPVKMDGMDLTRPFDESRLIYMETLEGFQGYEMAPILAVRDGRMKYIYGPEPELYDLQVDPYENANLIDVKPEVAAKMETSLSEFFGGDLQAAAYAQPTGQLSEQERAQLAALGYIGAGGGGASSGFRELPDPKKMMPVVREGEMALQNLNEGDVAGTIDGLNDLLEDHPDFYILLKWLADAYLRAKDLENARKTFERCAEVHPADPRPQVMLARLALHFRDVDEAIKRYEATLNVCPDDYSALFELAAVLTEQRREPVRAANLFYKAYCVRPDDKTIVEQMAAAMRNAGRSDEAIKLLTERLDHNPDMAETRNALGRLLLESGRCDEAVAVMREGVRRNPSQLEMVNNLAFTVVKCTKSGSLPPWEAAVMMEQLCQKTDYHIPEYLRTLAVIYRALDRVDEAVQVAEQAQRAARDRSDTDLVNQLEEILRECREAKAKGITPNTRQGPAATQPSQTAEQPKEPL